MISLPKGPGKKEGVFMFDTLKVAKRIRDGRNAKNMTQMELADKLGVSFQAVSNWERGASMPDISKLSDLSEILSISISELLGSEDKSSISVEKVIENMIDIFLNLRVCHLHNFVAFKTYTHSQLLKYSCGPHAELTSFESSTSKQGFVNTDFVDGEHPKRVLRIYYPL